MPSPETIDAATTTGNTSSPCRATAASWGITPLPRLGNGMDMQRRDQRANQHPVDQGQQKRGAGAERALREGTRTGDRENDRLVGHDHARGEDEEEQWVTPVQLERSRHQPAGRERSAVGVGYVSRW
jgi:hypothetical protein